MKKKLLYLFVILAMLVGFLPTAIPGTLVSVALANPGAGDITTVAGNGTAGFSGDGGPATAASLYYPYGIALDRAGNLFIGDYTNHRIRKMEGVEGVAVATAPAELVSIAVTPTDLSIALGQTQQFTATGTYDDASTANITDNVTWTSSDTTVATIDTAGLATALAAGNTTITASWNGYVSPEAELNSIQTAVIAMMVDNLLSTLKYTYGSINATNDMLEFPDNGSAVGTEKVTDPNGNAYSAGDRNGYVLYQHDITADGSNTTLVNYVATRYTRGTYSVDTYGTVNQTTTGYEGMPIPISGNTTFTVTVAALTIQALVDAASPGDTIIVGDGTYIENVNVDKPLTIQSANGANSTIVQAANATDHVFEITADNVTISGFTVTGATAVNKAGIYLGSSAEYATIANNTVSNNTRGIYLWNADKNSIMNNTISNNNEGITIVGASKNSISNNNFYSNTFAGIRIESSGSYGNSIMNNIISNNGWGIYIAHNANNNVIYLNNFIDNSGIYLSSDSTNTWNSPEEITYNYGGNTFTSYLGNYWSDYGGSDGNNDGIGDTPYSINTDNDSYPLMAGFEGYISGIETGGSISGYVYQSGNTTPISGAEIVVFHYGTLLSYGSTLTNADGYYQLTGLATGRYAVQVNAAGYASEWYDNTYNINEAIPVSVTAPNDTSGIDFSLVPGGTISGHVYQSDNTTTINGAMVLVMGYEGALYGLTWSGADGSYTIGLLAGEYAVWVLATGYASEWYDNTYYENEATPVSVTVPDDTPNISFSLDAGGAISGYTYQSDNVTPIEGAQVVAFGSDGGVYGIGWSEADGSYTTTGLLTGEYTVQVAAEGYISEWYDNTYNMSEATPVSVTAPDDTSGINFTLEMGGTISGHVYESDNITPIANLFLLASDSETNQTMAYTYTDSSGNYTLTGLPGGSYKVGTYATYSGLNYIDEWYDDVYNRDEATPVSVTVGQEVSNINFSLDIGGTISGTVIDGATSQPIANLQVNAHDYETNEWMADSRTDASGNYTLVVPTGSYSVETHAAATGLNYVDEVYDNEYGRHNADPVSVTSPNDTSGIDFSLEIGGTISGTVTDNVSQPIANLHIQGLDYETNKWMAGTNTDASGNYTLIVPTGSYRIRACASCDGFNFANEYYDNVYFRDEATPVAVTAPDNIPDINFSLEPGGTISGTVYRESDNTTIANLHIQVFDAATNEHIESTNTDASGNYTLSGLPAGSYKVRTRAAETGLNFADKWYDDVYRQDEATPVSVTPPDDTPNINFSLEVGGSISGTVLDENTGLPLNDASSGSVNLTAGWHKFVYRQQENEGGQASRAAFKAPGDTDWRWFSTSELEIRTSPDPGAESGILLINKKNTWDKHPESHGELVACVDIDSTEESGWYGSSVVSIVNQSENIHGNDDYYTSYYEGYFYVDTAGTWYFSTDSDDASEIVIDEQVVAYWYSGHGTAKRWEHKMNITVHYYDTDEWVMSTVGNADGSYTIGNLPAGSYTVQASAPGYLAEFYDDVYNQEDTTPVSVTAPDDTPNINFSLEATIEKPDLVISSKHEEWVDEEAGIYKVYFTLKNRGNAVAPGNGYIVLITIDGVEQPSPLINWVLAPGDTWNGSNSVNVTLSGEIDEITVRADAGDNVTELNEDNNSRTNTWPPKDWTFMVYMAADNDLDGVSWQNINEMEMAGSTDNVSIVVLRDGGDYGDSRIYYIEYDEDMGNINSPVVSYLGEVNTGDPRTLINFVNWTRANYPADHYALVLWDSTAYSGVAWRGMGVDNNSGGDYLTIAQIFQSLAEAGFDPDLVGFDTSLMALAEVAYELDELTTFWPGERITVASQEFEPKHGWAYWPSLIALTANSTMTATDLASQIITDYINFNNDQGYNWATLSAVDSGEVANLATAIDSFALAMMSSTETGIMTKIRTAREASERFWFNSLSAPYVDLYDFADKVYAAVSDNWVQSRAQGLMNAVNLAVVAEEHGSLHEPGAHGISIYYPTSSDLYKADYATGLAFTANTTWDEFLSWILVSDTTPPSTPILVKPSDNATASAAPVLEWEPVDDASGVSYDLQVSDNISFPSPLVDKTGLKVRGDPKFYRVTPPLAKGSYYWRVQAVDSANNTSGWSEVWSFEVRGPTPMWSYTFQPALNRILLFGQSVAIADLGVNTRGTEEDSDLEIATGSDEVGVYNPELDTWVKGTWRVFDSEGNVEWARDTESDQARTVAIADLDGDGNLEIIGGTTSGETVEVMDKYGNFVWTFPNPPRSGNSMWLSSPAVADVVPGVDGLEVIIGNRPLHTIFVFDGDNSDGVDDGISASDIDWSAIGEGTKPWEGTEGVDWDILWIFTADGKIISTPAVADVDGDGQLEVVFGAGGGTIYSLNGADGSLEWSYQTGAGAITSSVGLADFDDDGDLEVVVGAGNGKVYFINNNGDAVIDASEVTSFQTGDSVHSSPSIGDVDGDGNLEVVIGSNDGKVYSLAYDPATNTVTEKWHYTTGGAVYSSAALANRITGDLNLHSQLLIARSEFNSIEELVIGRTAKIVILGTSPDPRYEAAKAALDSYGGNYTPVSLPFGDIYEALQTGAIDAMVIGEPKHPLLFVQQLISELGVNLLPWSSPAIQAVTSQFPRAVTTELPANTYTGQTQAIPGYALRHWLDIYIGSEDGILYVLDGISGIPILWRLFVGAPIRSSPSVADIDGDGVLEVVFADWSPIAEKPTWRADQQIDYQASGDILWVFKDGKSDVSHYATEWPMFRNGPERTGLYSAISCLPGDANGDGNVNAIDITKVERIIAGLDPPTCGADANQDSNINAIDITKIERIIAGLD